MLLLSDLNSNVPVTIAPQNIQAIITGSGDKHGQIKYIKDGISDKFTEKSVIYTSGTGAIFKSGIPIGKLNKIEENEKISYAVEFYSDFSQLKYVFAEIVTINEIQKLDESSSENRNPIDAKIKILEDEIKIIEDSNLKFKEENDYLKVKINDLNNQILNLNNEITKKDISINQFNIDKSELEFLRLNLIYSNKCQSRKLFNTGFKVGTPEYKDCILRKGRKINE